MSSFLYLRSYYLLFTKIFWLQAGLIVPIMRNIVILLNHKTNTKLALSNRKLAWELYEKICVGEQHKYIQYAQFVAKINQGSVHFLDFELFLLPLNNPLADNLDELYKTIRSRDPLLPMPEVTGSLG